MGKLQAIDIDCTDRSSCAIASVSDVQEKSTGTQPTTCAPVVVFCYRRPEHLRRTLVSLMRCDGFESSPIIVFGDGPKTSEQEEAVKQTRETAKAMLGGRAEYFFRDENAGLARSVISGVNEVVGRFGRAVVIEDDLELAPRFLTYMNRALECFAHDERVWQVSGYMFDVPEFRSRSDALFLPMTVSWGWATWKRAWEQFDLQATGWERLYADESLRRQFNLDGAYDYAKMLKRQMSGQLDSWAIRWYWTVFSANGLVLFPPNTLANNHGLDGSGSHGRGILRKFSYSSKPLLRTIPSISGHVNFCEQDYRLVVRTVGNLNGGRWRRILDSVVGFFR